MCALGFEFRVNQTLLPKKNKKYQEKYLLKIIIFVTKNI